jgi:hypothetical protein
MSSYASSRMELMSSSREGVTVSVGGPVNCHGTRVKGEGKGRGEGGRALCEVVGGGEGEGDRDLGGGVTCLRSHL